MIVYGWARTVRAKSRPGCSRSPLISCTRDTGSCCSIFAVRDVGRAIDFLRGRGLAERGVDLLGCSTGAATVMPLASTEPLVQAVAEDSGYADLHDVLADQVPKQSGLPDAFAPGTIFMVGLLVGADP